MKYILIATLILMSNAVSAGLIYYPDNGSTTTCLTDAKGKIISCDRK